MKYLDSKCENCGKATRKPARYGITKYCSLECCYEFRRKQAEKVYGCAFCHAYIGLGPSESSRVTGMERDKIAGVLRKGKIERVKPSCGSWKHYKPYLNISPELQEIYTKSRMTDIKDASIGFDWGCIWRKRRMIQRRREYQRNKYRAMTKDEKKERYKKQIESRRARHEKNPECRQRYLDRLKEDRKKPERKEYKMIYQRSYIKRRARNDPAFRARINLRDRFKRLMKTTRHGGAQSFSQLIGCTTYQLHEHMESRFTNRMTWSNYGTYWHVDHIIPCAAFDHTDKIQVKQCWHYTNLQPLEAKRNLEKSDAIERPQMKLMLDHY